MSRRRVRVLSLATAPPTARVLAVHVVERGAPRPPRWLRGRLDVGRRNEAPLSRPLVGRRRPSVAAVLDLRQDVALAHLDLLWVAPYLGNKVKGGRHGESWGRNGAGGGLA